MLRGTGLLRLAVVLPSGDRRAHLGEDEGELRVHRRVAALRGFRYLLDLLPGFVVAMSVSFGLG
jgi:hypothetical protein